ncbi:MAG: DUF4118 domain-containing protein [Firmicutes bacterium]|nr:DUF4118 domain-containing protein [Bacillota bacterium]
MPVRVQDFLKTAILLALATGLGFLARSIGGNTAASIVIYVLAAALTGRMAHEYIWGVLASVFGAVASNILFIEPFNRFDLSRPGYLVDFGVLLAVSVFVSCLIRRYRKQKEQAEDTARKVQGSYLSQFQTGRGAENEKMKNHLLQAISEDSKIPLEGIQKTAVRLCEEGENLSPAERRQMAESIGNESERQIRMIDNLQSVTQIGGDTVKVQKVPEIAEEVIASAVSQFSSANVIQTITVRMPEELIVVPMASALIRQVLLNLLDNAVRHSGDSTEIEISLSADDVNALFSVSDNGCGIPEAELPELFEYGVSKVREPDPGTARGFGMGLPTCKTIIQAHGGNLWAENNPDKGSCFRFTLPLE